jgi:hypothetical protein
MKPNTRTNIVETPINPTVQKKSKKETIKPTSNVDAAIVIPSSKPLKRKSNNTNDTIKSDNFMEICTSQFVPPQLETLLFSKK